MVVVTAPLFTRIAVAAVSVVVILANFLSEHTGPPPS